MYIIQQPYNLLDCESHCNHPRCNCKALCNAVCADCKRRWNTRYCLLTPNAKHRLCNIHHEAGDTPQSVCWTNPGTTTREPARTHALYTKCIQAHATHQIFFTCTAVFVALKCCMDCLTVPAATLWVLALQSPATWYLACSQLYRGAG